MIGKMTFQQAELMTLEDGKYELVFFKCELTEPFENFPAGSQFTFVNLDLQTGNVNVENINEELDDDEPVTLTHFRAQWGTYGDNRQI